MSLIRNTSWSAFAAVVMSAGRFGVVAMLAQTLAPAQLGELIFLQWLVETVFLFVSRGTPACGTRFFAHYRAAGRESFQAFERWYRRRSWHVTVVAALVTPAVAYALTTPAGMRPIALVVVWALSNGWFTVATARLQGLQQFKVFAISNLVFVAMALGGAFIIPSGSGASAAMLVLATAALAAAAVSSFVTPGVLPPAYAGSEPFANAVVERYAVNVWIATSISALVWSRAEFLFVRGFLSSIDTAMYGAALTISGLANLAIALVTSAVGPRMAELWGEGRRADLLTLSRTLTDGLILVAGIGIGFIVTFPSELLVLALGADYRPASTPLVLLAIGSFGLTSACANAIAQYETNGTFLRNANLAGAVLLSLSIVPLVFLWGIPGVALARCVTQMTVAAAALLFVTRRVSPTAVKWRNLVLALVLVLLVAGSAHALADAGLHARAALYAGFLALLLATLRMDDTQVNVVAWARGLYRERRRRQ